MYQCTQLQQLEHAYIAELATELATESMKGILLCVSAAGRAINFNNILCTI